MKTNAYAKREVEGYHTIEVNDRELAHILAALRVLQHNGPGYSRWYAETQDIILDQGFEAMSLVELDNLCERINLGD